MKPWYIKFPKPGPPPMTQEQVIEKILWTLQRAKFYDWYTTGNFNKWFTNYDGKETDKKIKDDVVRLFNLT
jgi:hypothetical protein